MSKQIFDQEERKIGVSQGGGVGQHRSPYKTYHIVLLGATGAGKSTIINAFDCSVRNINVIENPLFNPRIEENVNQVGDRVENFRSVTSNCLGYEITDHQKKEIFVILDTPGLDDTSGCDQDDINFSRILEHLSNMDRLQCIGLVIKASENRISISFASAIKRLTSIIPQKYLENIILLVTHDTGNSLAGLENMIFKCTSINKLQSMHVFKLKNGIYKDQVSLKSINDEVKRNKEIRKMSKEFGKSMKKIEKLKAHIRKNMKAFIIKSELMMLKKNNEKARIKLLETKNAYINLLDEKDRLEYLKSEILGGTKTLNDLKITISQTKDTEWVLQDCNYHNTVCESCFFIRTHSLCHERCSLEYTIYKNSNIFKGCYCINNGTCRVCGCSEFSHLHVKKTPVSIETGKIKTLESQFNSKEEEQKIRLNLENAINTKISELENKISMFSTEIRQCRNEIIEKFPNFNVTDQLVSGLNNIENEKKNEKNMEKYNRLVKIIDSIKKMIKEL